jgi:hypothetical protein
MDDINERFFRWQSVLLCQCQNWIEKILWVECKFKIPLLFKSSYPRSVNGTYKSQFCLFLKIYNLFAKGLIKDRIFLCPAGEGMVDFQ